MPATARPQWVAWHARSAAREGSDLAGKDDEEDPPPPWQPVVQHGSNAQKKRKKKTSWVS